MAARDKYSVTALFLLLIAEISVIAAMRISDNLWLWIVSVVAAIAILIIAAIGNKNNLEFKPKSGVASNLLANAITPRAISAFYLLFFVVHIGWISDSTLNLFLPKEYTEWVEVIVSFFAGIIGLFFLVVFFPRSEDMEGKNKIIVSGMSIPSVHYISPDKNPTDKDRYLKLNLRPLVRMLQLLPKDEIQCTLLILMSDGLKGGLKGNFPKVYKLITGKDSEIKYKCETKRDIEIMAEVLIKACAKREFPDRGELIDNLKIQWTEYCDYDDFDSCFKTLNKEINSFSGKDNSFIFNMTPGTTLIGGVITLLAMDPQRSLYYYRQSEAIVDDKDRLLPVVKDYESIRNVLSGTLENIRRKES